MITQNQKIFGTPLIIGTKIIFVIFTFAEKRMIIKCANFSLHFSSFWTSFITHKISHILCSDGSNNVQSSMFHRSKPKIGYSSWISNR